MIRRALTQLSGWLVCGLILWGTADTATGQNNRIPFPAGQKELLINSFELIWSTLRDQYWDPSMAGRDWRAVHDRYLPKLRGARDANEGEELLDRMIHELPSSHLAIIPKSLYSPGRVIHSPSPAGEKEPADASGNDADGSTGLGITVIDQQVVVERAENGSGAVAAGILPG